MLIPIPADFVTSTAASISTTMTNLWPVVIFVAAIPFAFYVIRLVKSLVPTSRGGRRGY